MAFQSIAPTLLLAAPRLGDPNFERTVVALGRHETEGALGWVLNGRTLLPVGELLKLAGLVPAGVTLPDNATYRRHARLGGPVAPQTGWLFLRPGRHELPNLIELAPGLAATGDPDALAAVLRGHGPADFRLVLGYAGWGPGQLEEEMKAGSWLPAPVQSALVLADNPDAIWDEAYKAATGTAPEVFSGSTWGLA
jgi:putative transcriptional regulator